ncbi:MAG: PQQ-binding-like beta-propeller repeat protein [Candidatus Omnitrophica bacterium]|nr:PQQ-binding-like beta-propeller repeat protein [Candidatus Omnitrophota bacterium]MCA9424428.1 PQQ-binding-like beta-propeller repeat protein [Candidatus Omnitrophota bacterium]MCA9436884.1 PQQ-binding-like beta-propeller repeat protein [Candidatus Omnitrophota bacterium]MCA9439397.1 PQQ-binding-like beta-propeller repeat protein [Candidatus Omnitrophota bacterium]MCB9768866.1 PQQ-binding-like beta-propeller repeat protein [Candidatus Omnitrophota bacterium]
MSLAILGLTVGTAYSSDWPQWGGDPTKNMASEEKGIVDHFKPGETTGDDETVDMSTTKNVKWVAKLGSQAYGNVTIADGRVYVGTNNESPRDPKHEGDHGNVYCLDEKTGDFLWQLVVPKLGAGKVSDWEFLGICSSPAVVGDRVFVVTNRCEVVCMDVHGMANGNDGPFEDEGQYMAGEGNPPIEPGPTDADILWTFDMRDELGVFPHNISSSSVLPHEGKLYVTTSNGQDWSHVNIPSPFAPALICLDQESGELLGEEVSGISERLMHCNWSSPAFAEGIGDDGLVIFGAGDGFCYGFNPNPVPDPDDPEFHILKEVFRCDCVPQKYKIDEDGNPIKYPAPEGPSEIIATPVVHDNKIYVAIGQDPEHGSGVGILTCIDATQKGDITKSGKIWTYDKINRSISTASIVDGLLFIADYDGFIHCLDAETGEPYWVHDTMSHIWSSTFVADGKIYLGNEDGILLIMKAGKEKEVLNEIQFDAPIYSTPVVSNGVLYVATQTHLYALENTDKK